MKCTLYEWNLHGNQPLCTECDGHKGTEVVVNNLFKDFTQGHRRKTAENVKVFPSNSDHETPTGTILKFRYPPPKITDIDGLFSGPKQQSNEIQDQPLLEFCPVYSKEPSTSPKHCENYPKHSSSSSCPYSNKIQEKGYWCVCSFSKKESNSTPHITEIRKYLIELKNKYHIGNHHRGRWVISEYGNNTIDSLWKKICKMLSHDELTHCNAKCQTSIKEIWLYCDLIDSIKVRQDLRKKLNIDQLISYRIHPYGVILQL